MSPVSEIVFPLPSFLFEVDELYPALEDALALEFLLRGFRLLDKVDAVEPFLSILVSKFAKLGWGGGGAGRFDTALDRGIVVTSFLLCIGLTTVAPFVERVGFDELLILLIVNFT